MRRDSATGEKRPARAMPAILAAAALLLALSRAACPAGEAQFRRDVEALTAGPNRLAGREDGSRAASAYVERRLREIGVAEIHVQEFPLIMPRMRECVLEAGGRSWPVYAARPNLLQASVTLAGGLEGDTVYVGPGRPADFAGRAVGDRIAVMDMDCGWNWLTAFACGAKAVLFTDICGRPATPAHHVDLPAALPRFYVPADTARSLCLTSAAVRVRLRAACDWERLRGRNVIGIIRGTRPAAEGTGEAMVLAAPLDAYSEVPELSRGARDAANAAALLLAAERFRAQPPARDVALAFFDGQALNHLGARAFYGALYRRMGIRKPAAATLEDRLADAEAERAYLEEVLAVLAEEDPFGQRASGMKRHLDALRLLRAAAFRHSGEIIQQLIPLRINLQKMESAGADPAAVAEAREGVARMRAEELAWNTVVRCVNERRPPGSRRIEAIGRKLVGGSDAERGRFMERLRVNLALAHAEARESCEARVAELDERRADTRAALALRDAIGPGRANIVLHVSLNLGDGGTAWSFVHAENSAPTGEDVEGLYSGLYKAIRETRRAMREPAGHFDAAPVSEQYPSRIFVPPRVTDSAAIARLFARFNLSAMTLFDPLPRQGLPADAPERLDAGNVWTQAVEAAAFLGALSGHEALSRDFPYRAEVFYDEETWSGSRAIGHATRHDAGGDPMQAAVVPGALVAAVPASKVAAWDPYGWLRGPPGFVREVLCRSQSNGNFEFPPITRQLEWPVFAAAFDAGRDGEGGRGIMEKVTAAASFLPAAHVNRYVNMVKGRGLTLVGGGYNQLAPTTIMRAASTARFSDNRYMACEGGNVITLFVPEDAAGVKLFNPLGMVMLNNEAAAGRYLGQGVPMEDRGHRPAASEQTSADLLNLNAYRLDLLRRSRVREESLAALHGRAGDLRDDALAGQDRGAGSYHEKLQASAAFSRRAYAPLVAVMKDLVTAVVFLLLLAIPFAFALERLLVGSPRIYRRLAWFAGFFLATFVLLYAVNPAFKLAATPAIIFLAFAVILLSSLVIFIMMRKLQAEIKRLQGLGASAHSVDVSRVSTMSAAVAMGISTMRRRPVRTLLTAVTTVLLTFTILTFASFSSTWGTRRAYVGPMSSGPPRVLVRSPLWDPITPEQLSTLRGCLRGSAELAPRWWVAPLLMETAAAVRDKTDLRMAVAAGGGARVATVSAAMGVERRDLEMDEGLRRCLGAGARMDLLATNGLCMSRGLATALGLGDADVGRAAVIFMGERLVYAGAFDPAMRTATFLDGSSVLPVDYRSAVGMGESEVTTALGTQASQGKSLSFAPHPPDAVVVVSSGVAEKAGGRVRAVTLYPSDPAAADAVAEDTATVSGLPTYVGAHGGVHRLYFGKVLGASGLRDLLIPVLLGGLIIFATMLGSVADREREIYTFSSLGLAPPHVAMLFFAESAIYAVVGGMGGYLLGQVVTTALSFLGQHGYARIPAMNFSSMNAVMTILTVMAIVLLSALYPAVKASRSANPGIQRSWRLPEPAGEVFDIRFPFTVSEHDLLGVASYLEEHFRNFSDSSVGTFTTLSCSVFRQRENDMLGFDAEVALAPFDLGVEQRMSLLSQPSDVEGIDEIRILIRRRSGAYGDWRRANKVFVQELRRQFLIWRTLDAAVADQYRERTLGRWERLAAVGRGALLADYGGGGPA